MKLCALAILVVISGCTHVVCKTDIDVTVYEKSIVAKCREGNALIQISTDGGVVHMPYDKQTEK